MRIWLINHHALPPTEPGSARHFSFARQWREHGHDVTVIASDFSYATLKRFVPSRFALRSCQSHHGVPFVFMRVPRYRGHAERLWNMTVFAFWVWSGIATSGLERPDVVIGSSLTLPACVAAERLARKLGVPFVLEVRDLWPQTLIDMGCSRAHPMVQAFGLMERYLYGRADQIVTLLPGSAAYMVKHGAPADRITWIPNGVDTTLLPEPARPGPGKPFTVMYTGAHGLTNALDSVVEAAGRLDQENPGEFRFRLIGEGPDKPRLRGIIAERGIRNITLEDAVPRQQLYRMLHDADAFIIAAKKTGLYQYGISPNKLHDYMAAGRPTIQAVEANNNPIEEAGAGITVPPEDADAIVEAARLLAAMTPGQRWAMGIRGRKYVEAKHSFPALALRFEQVLSNALSSAEGISRSPAGSNPITLLQGADDV